MWVCGVVGVGVGMHSCMCVSAEVYISYKSALLCYCTFCCRLSYVSTHCLVLASNVVEAVAYVTVCNSHLKISECAIQFQNQ